VQLVLAPATRPVGGENPVRGAAGGFVHVGPPLALDVEPVWLPVPEPVDEPPGPVPDELLVPPPVPVELPVLLLVTLLHSVPAPLSVVVQFAWLFASASCTHFASDVPSFEQQAARVAHVPVGEPPPPSPVAVEELELQASAALAARKRKGRANRARRIVMGGHHTRHLDQVKNECAQFVMKATQLPALEESYRLR
jgi:hypothetical protein